MKLITTVHFNRPDYTRQCLDHLSRCVGIENYTLLAYVEPGNEEVISLLRNFSACQSEVTVHPHRFGCNRNTKETLFRGFERSDYVIHLEDDVLFAPDTLLYFEWARQFHDSNLLSISAYHRSTEPADPHLILHRLWFCPWGWATWKNRWETIQDHVTWDPPSWDCHFARQKAWPISELHPAWSRSQNIGALSGIHVPSPEWHQSHQHVPSWIGTTDQICHTFYGLNEQPPSTSPDSADSAG